MYLCQIQKRFAQNGVKAFEVTRESFGGEGAMRNYLLLFALIAMLFVPGQSQECHKCDGISELKINKSQYPNIYVLADVFEVNNSSCTVFNIGCSEPAKEEMYKFLVANSGNTRLDDVTIYCALAKGMKFSNTAYYEAGRGKLSVKRNPIEFDEEIETNLVWEVGSLSPDEMKSILLKAYLKPEVNNTLISVRVVGFLQNGTRVEDSQKGAYIRTCTYAERDSRLVAPNVPLPDAEKVCPDWILALA